MIGRKVGIIAAAPTDPKLGWFSGNAGEQIESFLFQFGRTANRRQWSADHSACRLLDLLGGRALEFVKRLPETALHDYEQLAEHLRLRFSFKMNPRTARKELSAVKQTEGESLEEFSQKVGTLALDGYTTMDPQSLNELSVEAFLRGVSDKFSARHVIEKDSKTISEALQSMKEFQASNKAIFGTSSPKSYQQRCITSFPHRARSPDIALSSQPNPPTYRSNSPYRYNQEPPPHINHEPRRNPESPPRSTSLDPDLSSRRFFASYTTHRSNHEPYSYDSRSRSPQPTGYWQPSAQEPRSRSNHKPHSPGTRSRPYPQPQHIGQSGNPESNQRFAPESTLPLNGQELSK